MPLHPHPTASKYYIDFLLPNPLFKECQQLPTVLRFIINYKCEEAGRRAIHKI
jgi:hypothetical protein